MSTRVLHDGTEDRGLGKCDASILKATGTKGTSDLWVWE